MKTSTRKKRHAFTARNKMMDLLARRDHSEKELRKKLKEKEFSVEAIDQAIDYGKTHGWIPNSTEANQALSEKMAASLRRKGKGTRYVNNYLKEKGLPPVGADRGEELEKARELVENKFSSRIDWSELDRDEKTKYKAKMGRFLLSRGFDMETVRKVIYETTNQR